MLEHFASFRTLEPCVTHGVATQLCNGWSLVPNFAKEFTMFQHILSLNFSPPKRIGEKEVGSYWFVLACARAFFSSQSDYSAHVVLREWTMIQSSRILRLLGRKPCPYHSVWKDPRRALWWRGRLARPPNAADDHTDNKEVRLTSDILKPSKSSS